MFLSRITILLLLCCLSNTLLAAHYHDVEYYPPWQDGKNLGQVDFATSSKNPKAQATFNTGMKLYYSYEFPEAIYAFREAQTLEPSFAMAYWGEAMSNYMLVWYSKNVEKARSALEKMKKNVDISALSMREQSLIDAAVTLSGKKGQNKAPYENGSSVKLFNKKMQSIYQRYPNDQDIAVLYGYSVLGTRRGVLDYDTNFRAGNIFEKVLEKNPQHPGALHFTLHSFENPQQAFRAKKVAKNYAQVASAAIHALHMPSHCYFAQGDWNRVIEVNLNAWEQSYKRMHDLDLTTDALEYHGYGWVVYAYLQQGNYHDAYKSLQALYTLNNTDPSPGKRNYLIRARAHFLTDTPHNNPLWKKIFEKKINNNDTFAGARVTNLFVEAYGNWLLGDRQAFDKKFIAYNEFLKDNLNDLAPPEKDAAIVMGMQLSALQKTFQDNYLEALSQLRKASDYEKKMVWEHGIPLVVKPSDELLGDILLAQGRSGEALFHYKTALQYYSKRKMSLDGAEGAKKTAQDLGSV